MSLYDFHTHTHYSGDCDAPMNTMIEQAISLGIKQLCITDHYDYDYPQAELANITFEVNLPAYYEGFLQAKEKYGKQIELLFGIEVGLQRHIYKEIEDNLKPYPFDFIIGSSHVLDRLDPYNGFYYEGKTKKEAYNRYLENILYHVEHYDYYSVYGHLDYIIRYGHYEDKKMYYHAFQEPIDAMLKAIIHSGHGIELNTSGYRNIFKEPHPNTEILKRYRELGGEIITLGSDAHKPKDLASHFEEAKEVLRHCGYKYFTIYKAMKPSFVSLT